ncbi:hypothetical protein C5D04_11165 [Rathayibacter sp. AY1D2]|uniref:hypothetical protein n=1 Tax=Rathayibacter sp. AY1D2 TaxID=2080543 RepID=UPI000CE86AB4|nr:hypothetical protein [Rathayibacter sp. AY1D2]PPI12837.1 hypothetical protein C5D04_11165 [Rathayibacter sp. AY1D2]
MLLRTTLRPPVALLVGVALALSLTACSGPAAEVPDGTVRDSGSVATAAPAPTGTADPESGARMTRLISDCLARYGLSDRPPLASPLAEEEVRLAAQRARDAYDATLTDCSAQALASGEPSSDPTGEPGGEPTDEPDADSTPAPAG